MYPLFWNRRKMKAAINKASEEVNTRRKKRRSKQKSDSKILKKGTAAKSAAGRKKIKGAIKKATKEVKTPKKIQPEIPKRRSERLKKKTATKTAPARAPDYNTCVKHPGEKVRMWCIDCDSLLCGECLPEHRRHALTVYRILEKGEIMRKVDSNIKRNASCVMMKGSGFYFYNDGGISTYNMNTENIKDIDTDGRDIIGICVSPDNSSIWYYTDDSKVYEYKENGKRRARFTFDSGDMSGICVTRRGHVVLGVFKRFSDDSDSDSDDSDNDSDDSDSGHYRVQCYLEMYTQKGSCITSVCIKGKRGLMYGVKPDCIRECPVTGDLLVNGYAGKTVLLTDDKCSTKYWFRGKTVTNKYGVRKPTGYDSRLCTLGAACFDKEGNILILNESEHDSVIVINHDTGMYIRTVHQEPTIYKMCIQGNGLLWCFVVDSNDDPTYKLKSIKYMEKLE